MLNWLKEFFSKTGRKCRQINNLIKDKNRVNSVNKECPDCICENHKMSKYSPGPILNTEKLTRFVFSPVHVGKSKIKPSVFSHVYTVGCSIQRESIASDEEITRFLRNYLSKNTAHSWYGILTGDCNALRELTVDHSKQRSVCIYDTSEKDNIAHAELHNSQHVISEEDRVELRAKLFEIFNNGENTEPHNYRNNSIISKLEYMGSEYMGSDPKYFAKGVEIRRLKPPYLL